MPTVRYDWMSLSQLHWVPLKVLQLCVDQLVRGGDGIDTGEVFKGGGVSTCK